MKRRASWTPIDLMLVQTHISPHLGRQGNAEGIGSLLFTAGIVYQMQVALRLPV